MKMHILLTGLVSKTTVSGGDQLILDLVPHLPKELDIVVITPDFVRKYWVTIKRKNLKVITVPTNKFDFSPNPIAIFFSYCIRALQVYRVLKKEKNIEILFSCSDIAYADIWPAYFIVGRNRQIKWITRIYHVLLKPGKRRGDYLTNFFAFYLQRLCFWMIKKRSRYILAINKKLKKEILDLGFPKNKTGILEAGVDFNKIKSFVPDKKYSYDVVAMGRIAPEKGIFDIVKIWKKVLNSNSTYNMAWIGGGNQNHTKKLQLLIQKEKLTNSFHLLGFIDKKEVFNILKSAKVFICSDHENGWGLAVCEAMSCGLPVVSYDIDIFGGVYKKGFLSAKLFDTDNFANNLIKVLKDNTLRKKLGRQALSQVSLFRHEKVAKVLMRYLSRSI